MIRAKRSPYARSIPSRITATTAVAAIVLSIAGCRQTPTTADIGALSTTYADLLMVQQSSRSDTAHARKSIDSVLKLHGYDTEQEFRENLKEIGRDPEVMRKIFDSTQQRLQAITNEALPPPPAK